MDFEKILPIILLIVWSIAASQAQKKKKRKRSEESGDQGPKRPARTTERPARQQPQRPAAPRPKPVFQDIRQTLQNVFDELGEAVRQDLPSPAERKRPGRRQTKAERASGKTRIEKEEKRSSAEKRRPEEVELESMTAIPKELKPVDLEPRVEVGDFELRSPGELRRAVVWSEIIGKPVSLRDRPVGMP
jgi:hypothetical protein